MSNATKTKRQAKPEAESADVLEHFWPDHLSGQEVKTKWPRGRNAVVERVAIEAVFDKQINADKQMVVVYFDGINRGLVVNKTNGRWLAEKLGSNADQWTGKEISLVAANRSNGTIGVDLGEAFDG